MPISSPCRLPLIVTMLFILTGLALEAEEPPELAVKFGTRGVSFSGVVPSEDIGQDLAEAVKAVRPDLAVINEGIEIDESADLPNLDDLKSLLAEIGISTHEGGIAIWDDTVLLSGLTDSRITLAALKIRLDPLLGSRKLINRICIVPTDDLPDIAVKLSSGETAGPLLDFDYYPSAEELFEAPGIRLEKLFPTMAMLADLSVLDDANPLPAPDAAPGQSSLQKPLRAVPLMTSSALSTAEGIAPALFRAEPTGPMNTYVTLEPIRYSRNSFFLQANQSTLIDETIKLLNDPPLAGHKVVLSPVRYQTGAGAYGDYLVEKRGQAAKDLLLERGLDPSRIILRDESSSETEDLGEVNVVVEIPPPPEPVEEAEESEEEAKEEEPPAEAAAELNP